MLEANFGMKLTACKEQLMRHMQRDLLEKMLVDQDTISMYMFIQEQALIFVVKKLVSLRACKESQESQD